MSWREIRVKTFSTVAAAAVIAIGAWAWQWASSNVVFAGDLEGLGEMMAAKLAEQIKPLEVALEASSRIGRFLNRTPQAANIAFVSAGAAFGIPISPHPDGDTFEGMMCTSIRSGASASSVRSFSTATAGASFSSIPAAAWASSMTGQKVMPSP